MKRVAVIDIGSGTTTLAIFEASGDGFLDRVAKAGKSLRLIEKLDADGRLANGAARSLLTTVAEFVRSAREQGVDRVEVVATSAMRDAVNGVEIVQELNRLHGVTARVISGEQEGRLAAHTVVCTLPLSDGVVVDLGGGSLQLVRIASRRAVESVSLPLGALRLYAAFLAGGDPPDGDALVRLRRHVLHHLDTVPWLRTCGGPLVAVGGSARLMGKIHRRAQGAQSGHGHGYAVDTEAVVDHYERLSRLPSAARRLVPGLAEERADTIVAASLTLATVLRYGAFDVMNLSTYGIREGVAFRALFGETPVGDPAGAGIHGRVGDRALDGPAQELHLPIAGLNPRERRLYAAAIGHPTEWLLAKPIQGFWHHEVVRVVAALERLTPLPVEG